MALTASCPASQAAIAAAATKEVIKISIVLFFIGTFGEESADHERNLHDVGCGQRRCAARVVGYFSLDRCVQVAAIVEAAQQ
jgi:hypothetical protein